MIKPERLKIGDTIGVVAPSSPIFEKNKEELEQARKIVEKDGFKVKYSKNLFLNTNGYSSTAKEKAQDINEMFKTKSTFPQNDKVNFLPFMNRMNTMRMMNPFNFLRTENMFNNPMMMNDPRITQLLTNSFMNQGNSFFPKKNK